MRNIKHHRLASVNREESKELWALARRNPAFKDLHALFEKVFCLYLHLFPILYC